MRALKLCLSLLWGLTAGTLAWAADLAVVIDDVGYNKERGMRAIHLPAPVTLAVLPMAPHTQLLARHAAKLHKDVILHQPMEPHPAPHVAEEHDTLRLTMSHQEFDDTLIRALDAVPQRLGVSNHTGSLLTQHRQPMLMLMHHLRARNLFFLDSRTTAQTVAVEAANEVGVLALKRDVFLDNIRTHSAIAASFNQAIQVARRNGSAIIIGHPHPESLTFLEQKLMKMPSDIKLVGLAELATKHRAMLAQRARRGLPHISLGQ